ncbi:MAG: efflux RND transporter periplasmic adaptor subunit [Deltaproteobacteria bacterium]|nr:efflux RND transporter periplasmic adaptor subunit [Deltaproteobacteria bacterium]
MPSDLDRLRIPRSEEKYQTRTSFRGRLWLALVGALLLILLALYLWGPLRPAQEVTVAVVSRLYPGQAFTVLNASGYVVAQRKAAVSSKSTGRLAYLGVEEGSRVKKGEIIASLENEDLVAAKNQAAAAVKEADAGLVNAQAELVDAGLQYKRYKTLVEKELVAHQDFDTAVARYKKAQAGVASAQARIRVEKAALANAQASLEYSYIRSPFDGVVTSKYAEVGEVVAPFGAAVNARAAVVTMADLKSLMVEADVAESNLDKVKLGQPCEISLDAIPGRRFAGEVHMIVPTADRTKATVLTKVKFLEFDNRILPEMSAKVAFLSRALSPGERQPRLTVSKAALVPREGQNFAYVVKDNEARLVKVGVGETMGDLVEVLSGLKEGDRVVLKPPPGLADGARVKVKE